MRFSRKHCGVKDSIVFFDFNGMLIKQCVSKNRSTFER